MTFQEYVNQESPKKCSMGEVKIKRSECRVYESGDSKLISVWVDFGKLGQGSYVCKSDDPVKFLYTADENGNPKRTTVFQLVEDEESENEIKSILEAINSKIEQLLSQSEAPLTFPEACKYLDMSKSTLYKMTCTNQIPHFKPNGKKIYFKKGDLNKWIFGKTNIHKE